jgi:alkanesulfonate monooxygenase SsuD/methylene tetrahydromethanopterin reductase-like flavin-dependent oxidoreductase (luciferase family)
VATKKPTMKGSTADWTDSFDKGVEHAGKAPNAPPHIVDAAVYVRDTLDLAWKAAESVFDKKATPEIALAIYDRIDAERKLREANEALNDPT